MTDPFHGKLNGMGTSNDQVPPAISTPGGLSSSLSLDATIRVATTSGETLRLFDSRRRVNRWI